MSIAKDLLFIILFIFLVFVLKRNFSLRRELFSQRENFIKTLSHDIRVSELAQLRGINLLQKRYSDDELLNDIDDSCRYSLDMINILLNTYRYENGEQVLNYEIFNFSEIVAENSKKLSKQLQEKEIEIYYPKNSSEALYADKNELAKMLFYLLSTTIYYSYRNNKISIIVHKTSDDLSVSITYSGKSLSEEECRRMFLNNPRFSTVGHGIKMYLCKKIIEFHGGKIVVSNCGEKINTFTFNIPLKKYSTSFKPLLISMLQPFNL